MYQTITFSDFVDAFRAYSREEQFTYEGKQVLFDYLENYEDETGERIELDVVALCCEYNESTLDEINNDYGQDFETLDDAEAWISDQTALVGSTDVDTIIFVAF